MNQIRNPKLAIALSAILIALGACMASDTNPPAKTPEIAKSSTNPPAPVELESVKAAQSAGKPLPRPTKPVAIVLRHVHAVQVGGQVVLVVPERYLADLTNIYPSQVVEKLALEEP